MIKTVIKRNGDKEAFNPDKLNKWAIWATKDIQSGLVNWSEIVINTISKLPEEVTTTELQTALINACLDKETWSYSLMAGKLYATQIQKDIYNDKKLPSIKKVHQNLIKAGIMIDLGYSDDEYAELNKYIDHNRDLTYPHFALELTRQKYTLKNVVTKQEYETLQYSCMRMAMEVAKYANEKTNGKIDKIEFAKKFYDYTSKRKINVPTPYWTNIGTKLRGFASCCLVEAGDSADSLDAGKLIAGKMTQQSAGLGLHWVTRSINDPVRGGAISHLGKLPCYNAVSEVMKEFTQQGRGGAATMFYSAFDPEVVTIQALKNPMTPLSKQNRKLDYAILYNQFFIDAVKNDEMINLYSYADSPELYDAMSDKDQSKYGKIYNSLVKKGVKPKATIRTQDILANVLTESFETGRHYEVNLTNVNTHTPFNDSIRQSNLCNEINLPTKKFNKVEDLYKEEETSGEVAICNIAGIVYPNIDSDEELEIAAELVLWLIDFGVNESYYKLPNIGYTAKKRLSAGVGIVGLAEEMAKKGYSFQTRTGLEYIHSLSEKHYYFLLKASLKLSKLLGVAEWMHKTKWPQGWLPIDTYNKNVDDLVKPKYNYDWESLRKEIIENGGIRNSVLVAHMPAETSSLSSATTNGVYPIRDKMLLKRIGKLSVKYFVPFSDQFVFESAWDIPNEDMIYAYAVIQKFTDQGISLDEWFDVSDVVEKVDVNKLIELWLLRQKYGTKSKYYTNTKTSKGNDLDNIIQKSKHEYNKEAELQQNIIADDDFCESCTL